jgi:hypothetical protein
MPESYLSFLAERLRISHAATSNTMKATPTNPAKKTSPDSKFSQLFPNDHNRMTPIKNALTLATVDQPLFLFLICFSSNSYFQLNLFLGPISDLLNRYEL